MFQQFVRFHRFFSDFLWAHYTNRLSKYLRNSKSPQKGPIHWSFLLLIGLFLWPATRSRLNRTIHSVTQQSTFSTILRAVHLVQKSVRPSKFKRKTTGRLYSNSCISEKCITALFHVKTRGITCFLISPTADIRLRNVFKQRFDEKTSVGYC